MSFKKDPKEKGVCEMHAEQFKIQNGYHAFIPERCKKI